MKDNFNFIGTIKIIKYLEDKIEDIYEHHNLITNVGKDHLLKLIGGDNSEPINKIAFGSGTTAASYTDTQLNNSLYLANVSRDYSITGRINFLATIPENTFNQIVNYNEAGLVHKSGTKEILISRVVFGDTIYQKPENSLSILYSLELVV